MSKNKKLSPMNFNVNPTKGKTMLKSRQAIYENGRLNRVGTKSIRLIKSLSE
ncbi:MAG: hypothetical protein PHD39_10765 [Methylobacter tundripaludum]|nr:hypothetical protein [Methylobacter tundripaludum]